MNSKEIIKEFESRSRELTAQELAADQRFSPTRLKVRRINKENYEYLLKKHLKALSEEEQAHVWLEVYKKSPYRNLDSIAIDFFKSRKQRKNFDLSKYFDQIFSWVSKIDCWMTGDMLASMTSHIHESDPQKYYPRLKALSSEKSPWLNRMSLLSLYYYSSCREEFPTFKKSVDLVNLHLEKDHYYLQKSVGWTLREMNNVYPKETQSWLEKNILLLSPVAFTTAVEKIKGPQKEIWKDRRRQSRRDVSI